MYAVIRCEDKEKYIGRILQLSQVCQGELMVFIETVLAKFEKKRMSLEGSGDEVLRLQQTNATLTKDLETMTQELAEERGKQDELRRQIAELTNDIGKAAKKPDTMRIDLETQLAEKTSSYLALSKQIDEMKKTHAYELTSLRDELDVANERLVQVSKLEVSLEGYKKKADAYSVVNRQLKELQAYNESLQEKLLRMESESAAITKTQHSLTVYKDQITQEKEKSAGLCIQLIEKEKEIKDLHKEKLLWEERKLMYETKIERLNEELEKTRTSDSISEESLSSFHKTYDLEEQIKFLQSENRRLQMMIGNEELVRHFNEQIDAAMLAKQMLEDKVRQITAECTASKSKVADLEGEIIVLQSVNSKLQESEAEKQRMQSDLAKLQSISQENEHLKSQRDTLFTDLKNAFRDKDEVQRKFLEEKDEVHRYKTEITALQGRVRDLEVEKERLEKRLVETEGDAGREMSAAGRRAEGTKQGEIEIFKLRADNSQLRLELREKDDQMKDLFAQLLQVSDSKEKALREIRESLTSQHSEDMDRMRRFIEEKSKELDESRSSLEEQKLIWSKEEKLMAAAMHDIGVEVFKERTHKDPSYLAQQRDRAARG